MRNWSANFSVIFFQKVRSALLCELQALLVTPCFDVLVMSCKEHERNRLALPYFGACVLGIFKESAVNALVGEADLVGEDSLAHTGDSVSNYHCRELASCEYIIANGYLLVYDLVDNTLVYALIVTAENEDIVHF